MKTTFCLLLILLATPFAFAQELLHCGTDEMHQRLFMGFPELHDKIIQNHNDLEAFTQAYQPNTEAKAGVLYTIPVVFHIIHNYGAENISNDQIYDQMAILNEDFQKLNPDTSAIVAAFQSIAADCQLEFKLAKLDPLGNCTNGITRNVSMETYTGDHGVKSIVHWDPSMYLNVYICADAAGLAGHALLPASADTIPNWDGIVLRHDYCGSIGTSDPFRSTVLTHEIGHYLNLQHTWGGNNVPNFPYLPVADAGNCAFDDGVSDTPLTIGWQTCNLAGNTCSSLDNVQNYMEYAYCANMFTEGQKTRMHATLNDTIANRNNLWSPGNLAATGISVPETLCEVDFDQTKVVACVGDTIWFSDISYNAVTNRNWEFNGATINTQTDSMTFAVYNTPGAYGVKLVCSDGVNTDSVEKANLLTILPASGSNYFINEGFESAVAIPNTDWYTSNADEAVTWELNNTIGYDGSNSVYISNFGANPGQKDELISYPVDASGLTAVELEFKYAYAKTGALSSDNLKVYVSNNCGETWILRKSISTFALATMPDTVPTAFTPANQSEWKTETVTNIISSFLVDNLQIKFTFESGGGNNIYLDNINLYDPNTISVPEIDQNGISAYPNPTRDLLNLKISGSQQIESVEYWSLAGQLLKRKNGVTTSQLDVSWLKNGSYILRVKTTSGIQVVPFNVLR